MRDDVLVNRSTRVSTEMENINGTFISILHVKNLVETLSPPE